MAYVDVGDSRIFKNMFVSQLNGNPSLYKYRLTWIKDDNLCMKNSFLNIANRDTILNLGSDYRVCF